MNSPIAKPLLRAILSKILIRSHLQLILLLAVSRWTREWDEHRESAADAGYSFHYFHQNIVKIERLRSIPRLSHFYCLAVVQLRKKSDRKSVV